jgi:hypothetical protein
MIPSAFGLEAAATGGPGRSVFGHPVPEARRLAHELAIGLDLFGIKALPDSVYHLSHGELIFP